MPFYQPDPNNPTLTDTQGNPINYQQYKSLGGLGVEGGGGWTDVTQGKAPLMPLSPTQPSQQDPIDIFNIKLMELMAKAQGANAGNPALMAQQNKLQNTQVTQSMAPAADLGIQNLTPSDAMAARQNESQLYNPEVKALNDRMQLNNEAVTRFSNTLEAAAKMGEQYAKMIKPSEQTVEAIRMQLRSGVLPSEEVLTKVQGQLTQDDWDAYVMAKSGGGSAPSSVQEYEYYKAQEQAAGRTPLSYQQFQDRASQYKVTGDNGPTPTEIKNAKILEAENKTDSILAAQRGKDQYISPQAWYQAREAWKADGFSASDFDSKFKRYTNPADPQDYGLS
jgi:hypothetical protein